MSHEPLPSFAALRAWLRRARVSGQVVELDEAGRALSKANQATLQQISRMLQKLLRGSGGARVPRTTAQGVSASANTPAPAEDTPPAQREALSEAGQDGLSFAEIGRLVQDALRARLGGGYPMVRDLFPDAVVYQVGWSEQAELYRCPYTIGSDNAVELGDAQAVRAVTIYVPENEDEAEAEVACPYCGGPMGDLPATGVPGMETESDDDSTPMEEDADADEPALQEAGLRGEVLLQEGKATNASGQGRIKIIAPGWGSSGYYAEEVLKRDGPGAFPKGTRMFIDHPTAAEEAARPERSVRDMGAVTTSDAAWTNDPTNGPGLYADVQYLGPFREAVDELAPHIGTSIRADGHVEAGEAEGRKGLIVKKLVRGRSVDFVTAAGAGGKVLSLMEAARARRGAATPAPTTPTTAQEESSVTPEEIKALQARMQVLEQQNRQLQEQAMLREASSHIASKLPATLHPSTRQRLGESLVAKAPVKDGQFDRAAFDTLIESAVREELAYLATLSESGRIVGMGTSTQPAAPTAEQAQNQLNEAFRALGLGDNAAKIAAGGR